MMKHLLHNPDFQLDEIIFQDRNKAYGAYDLRNNADQILTKSLFVGLVIFGLLSATPFIVKALKTDKTIVNKPVGPFDILDVDPYPEVKPPVIEPPKEIQKTVEINTQIPTPTKDAVNDNPPAKVEDYETAKPGFQEIKEDPPVLDFRPPVSNSGNGENTVKDPVVPTKVDDNSIKTKVDKEADFTGGIKSFRDKVVQNFNTSDFEGTGEKISTIVTFVVEKDGSISNIKTIGNDSQFNSEAEKTIKKIKGKWIPAQIKGEPVRSNFRFPISMMFE